MPIKDFCINSVVSISKDAALTDAAKCMRTECVGALVVTDKSRKAVGIITDRDIVVNALAVGRPMTTKIFEVMSKDVLQVPKDAGVADVIEKMAKREVRRAVVVDKNDRTCGLISSDDLLQLLGNEINSLGTLVSRQMSNPIIAKSA